MYVLYGLDNKIKEIYLHSFVRIIDSNMISFFCKSLETFCHKLLFIEEFGGFVLARAKTCHCNSIIFALGMDYWKSVTIIPSLIEES